MTTRLPFKTTFEPERVIQPIYTGGAVALDNGGRVLATALGEDVVLTNLATGRQYAKIEGVRFPNVALLAFLFAHCPRPSGTDCFFSSSSRMTSQSPP